MNLAEKPHQDADSAVSSVHRRSPVFRIRKPFLSKFITPSRSFQTVSLGRWVDRQEKGQNEVSQPSIGFSFAPAGR
jgi:hypothetical protein